MKSNIVAMPAERTKKILWFRNNLRTHDVGYWDNLNPTDEVVAVFCIEPFWTKQTDFGWKKMGVYRANFLLETLTDLKNQLKAYNIPLFVFYEEAAIVFRKIHACFPFEIILTNEEWTSEELNIEQSIKNNFPSVNWMKCYDQTFIHPEDLPFSLDKIPQVFTTFRKLIEKNLTVRTAHKMPFALHQKVILSLDEQIPTLSDLGYEIFEKDDRSAFQLSGGETAALNHLTNYIWENQLVLTYKETRNGLVGTKYSTKFSPWLANGSLSPRTIYREIKNFEKNIQANESTYWVIFELMWRDYFKYLSMKFGNLWFYQSGIKQIEYDWRFNEKVLSDWIKGETSFDFVNANMLELAQTGWMSNRGRQNVASFWAKNQQQDWRIGASYFESLLIDYDVHSNYGNWQYVSGVGNDPRDRQFNIDRQASMYDANYEFRNLWLKS